MISIGAQAGLVLVTGGGGSGIGAELVRVLATAGYAVAVTDLSVEAAKSVSREANSNGAITAAFELDVADPAQVSRVVTAAVEQLGPLKGLVNSAGRGLIRPLAEVAPAEWDALFSVDVRGAFLAIQACLPHLRSAGGGSIVNIGSVQAIRPSEGYSVYAAAKSALVSLTRSVAAEHGRDHVRCNVIHPGLVDTPANRQLMAALGDPGQIIDRFTESAQMLPIAVTAGDIAEGVRFLLSPAARSITATELVIDGGYSQLPRPLG